MKYALLIFCSLALLSSQSPNPTKTISLQEAVNQNLIQVGVKGNANSPHYNRPIRLFIQNLTNYPFVLTVPNGQRFLTEDSTVQDMIVVKSEQLALAPSAKKSFSLNAMCTQKQNRGPSENEPYTLGPMAESHLLEISKKIQQLEAYNTIGQYAIWTVSNNTGLEEISGFDESQALTLQQFVAETTGRKMPKKDTTDYLTNYNRPSLAVRTIGGKFEYGLIKRVFSNYWAFH